MTNEAKTDFKVDRKKNTLAVKREFSAARQLVWDCHTKSELLEKWFAPKPLLSKTKKMNFREGGHWLYAMIETNGTEHWGKTDYIEIKLTDFYKTLDSFSDDDGNINPDLPRARWTVTFFDLGDKSRVESVIKYDSLKDLEMVIEMGMQEGIASTFIRLDQYLTDQ